MQTLVRKPPFVPEGSCSGFTFLISLTWCYPLRSWIRWWETTDRWQWTVSVPFKQLRPLGMASVSCFTLLLMSKQNVTKTLAFVVAAVTWLLYDILITFQDEVNLRYLGPNYLFLSTRIDTTWYGRSNSFGGEFSHMFLSQLWFVETSHRSDNSLPKSLFFVSRYFGVFVQM